MNIIKNVVLAFGLTTITVIIGILVGFLLGKIKNFIVRKIDEYTKKTFRIEYAELFDGKIEKEECFGTAFVRVCERKYMIVRARNVESAMDKFYRELTKGYFLNYPKYAILIVTKEREVK